MSKNIMEVYKVHDSLFEYFPFPSNALWFTTKLQGTTINNAVWAKFDADLLRMNIWVFLSTLINQI